MSSLFGRGLRVLLVVLALTLGVVTGAVAYWTGPGAGSGTGANGTTAALTLTPATPTSSLYPGGQATVAVTVTNPNSATVRLESLALDTSQGTGGFAVDGAHSACGVSSLSYTTQTNGGAGWTIAGNDATTIQLTSAVAMSTAAANACQGAGFTIYLKAGS